VRLLLDTHAALWWLADDDRLGATAERQVSDPGNELLLSAAVVWEVAIKRSLGKLEAPDGFASALLGAGARPLAIGLEHAERAAQLPWHHRDPFDRILVAQAQLEGAVIVSHDRTLADYGVPVAW
jgi:PIN domain nuclease of toxin-antitoxin system